MCENVDRVFVIMLYKNLMKFVDFFCCEGVEVSKMGTVGELKRAVESAFDHLPKEGPDRVSW